MKTVAVIAVCDFETMPMGGEVFLLNNLLKNKPYNLDIKLIGMSFSKKDIVGKWNKKEINGIKYDFLPVCKVLIDKDRTKIPFRFRMVAGINKYYSKIKKEKIDIAYIHSSELVIPFINKKDIKLVYHVHGDPTQTLKISRFKLFRGNSWSKAYNYLVDLTINRSDKIIWAADRSKELYFSKRKNSNLEIINKSITIHSSFDDNMSINEKLDYIELNPDNRYLVTVGRLSKIKRIDFIIKSFYKVSEKYNDVKLIICGEGEERETLERLTEQLGLCRKVIFIGNANRQLLGYILSKSEVFVFASENEAMSLVVLESLYMGTPVVSTDVGDIALVVKEDISGEIVPLDYLESYDKAIEKVLNNGKKKYENNCKEIAKKFSPQNMAEKVYSVLENI